MSTVLAMWTLYRHPSDWPPGTWVARKFEIEAGNYRPTAETISAMSWDELEQQPALRGLSFLYRTPEDDPCIVGVYL